MKIPPLSPRPIVDAPMPYLQVGYDYLLDRFGIYVGTVRAALLFVYTALIIPDLGFWMRVMLFAVVAFILLRHSMEMLVQHHGLHQLLNIPAENAEASGFDLFCRTVALAMAIAMAPRLDFTMSAAYVWMLTTMIRVRDRDTDRFKRWKPAHSAQ